MFTKSGRRTSSVLLSTCLLPISASASTWDFSNLAIYLKASPSAASSAIPAKKSTPISSNWPKSSPQSATAASPAAPQAASNGRALPSPLDSPPFPDSDWLGFPLIGAPWSGSPSYPLEKALFGDKLAKQDIHIYGWLNPSFNASTSTTSNVPLAYSLVPNKLELDQAVIVVEKQPNTVQTDHQDWGFRFVGLYGTDYRYTIMKGIISDQLLKRNSLYGFDPVEMYGMLYYPKVAEGMVVRFGRYISPPDIEAQLTPDNYMFSHSLMFTVDPYTFMGINPMIRLSKQWSIMAQVTTGNDMAPWSDSSSPNVGLMARWASLDGKDGLWGGVNSIGRGRVRDQHDDLQQIVGTWGHKFNDKLHMMTEAYYMWEYDGNVGGTAIDGPAMIGTGGGAGAFLPGKSDATGIVNYFQIKLSNRDYISIRNDYLNDPRGYRTGFATAYSSHTLGYSVQLTPMVTFRPEIRYEHAYGSNVTPYDVGTRRDQWTVAADMIFRF